MPKRRSPRKGRQAGLSKAELGRRKKQRSESERARDTSLPKVGKMPPGRGTVVSDSVKERIRQQMEENKRKRPLLVPPEAEDFGGKQAPIIVKEGEQGQGPIIVKEGEQGQGPPPQGTRSTEDLLRQYNESPGAQDFNLTATYDEETGEYVVDVSSFGFEGEQATKRYSPEEFTRVLSGDDKAGRDLDQIAADEEANAALDAQEAAAAEIKNLLQQYNESAGAQDFGLSATYDEETGEYVADLSAFGFEGDQATKRYSPEAFARVVRGGDRPTQEPIQEPAQAPDMLQGRMRNQMQIGDELQNKFQTLQQGVAAKQAIPPSPTTPPTPPQEWPMPEGLTRMQAGGFSTNGGGFGPGGPSGPENVVVPTDRPAGYPDHLPWPPEGTTTDDTTTDTTTDTDTTTTDDTTTDDTTTDDTTTDDTTTDTTTDDTTDTDDTVRTQEFIDENNNGIDDRDEEKQPDYEPSTEGMIEDFARGKALPAVSTKAIVKKLDVEEGITPEEDVEQLDEYVDIDAPTDVSPTEMTTATATVKEAIARGDIDPANYEAALAEELAKINPAVGAKPAEAVIEEIRALTERAKAAKRDPEQEEAAKMEAAKRPIVRDYAKAVTTDERFKVIEAEDPATAQRIANTISEREQKDVLDIVSKEGTNLDDIPEFKLAERRTAQVGEASTKIAQELGAAPSVDLEGRTAITGTAPQGDASQIGGIPTMAAASMEAVTGTERTTAAADMMAVVANMPPDVTAAIAEDPATVEAQLDTGDDPVVIAAVAALPEEALVSTQMNKLLEGLETGTTPAWARPAVDAVNQMLAKRGMTASTVGRDALFNAIIQSSLPIAQGNAQALQQRAQQNLSNEQQANLASAQNTMQVRMANLANKQTAASQTAQMSQQIKVQQGTFTQEAAMTTAQQEQQTRMGNFQAAQQRASQESSQRQQTALANLDSGTRLDLANLQALNAAGAQNLTSDQQSRLATYNSKVARTMRKAELEQDMEKANLSTDLQMEMLNLNEQNASAKDTMTATNQERLTNLNTLVDFKKTNANLAQQMDLANMSSENQMELANLSERAATDAANMTEANKFRLTELSTYVNVMSQNTELRQRAELAQMSVAEKMSLANLTSRNQADSENMSAENLAELTKYDKKMNAATVNANLAQTMGLANLSNEQAAGMFNAQIDANMDMKQFDANQQASLANSQFMQSMTVKDFDARQTSAMQNATAMANLDMAAVDQRTKLSITNANNFLSMDMANLSNVQQGRVMDTQLRQQRILSDQSSKNAARQFNATSDNQINQFNSNMANQMSQFNAQQSNSMSQFNTAEQNRMEAIAAGNDLDAAKFNNQLGTQINQFNEQMDLNRDQWNAANSQAVQQSNISWRRQANMADTAAQNAVNQQNAANAFGMQTAALSSLWQQMRDEATFAFQAGENAENRETQLYLGAMGRDGSIGKKSSNQQIKTFVTSLINGLLGG